MVHELRVTWPSLQATVVRLRQATLDAAAESRPSHHLELRRPGSGQALTYAINVWRRDVDAQQHRALRNLALQGLGTLLWQTGGLENRRKAAGHVSRRCPKLRRQRPCRNNWPDPWHDQGDCRHHSAAQFSQECRRSRIFKVHAGRRVHSFSKGPRVGMAVCDDGDVFPADTEGMKRRSSLGGRGCS